MSELDPHPSALVIGRVLHGSASAAETADVERHAARCARCGAELADARLAREHFDRFVYPRTLANVEQRAAPRRWRGLLPALGLLAATAAAATIFLVLPRPGPDFQPKGGPALTVFARADGQVRPVADGAALRPGDSIRFGVQPGGPKFVLIASVDGRGAVNYYQDSTPVGAAGSPALELLEGSIELDDAPGPERVFAIFSEQRIARAEVSAALERTAAAGPEAIRKARTLDVPFAVASAVFEKVGR